MVYVRKDGWFTWCELIGRPGKRDCDATVDGPGTCHPPQTPCCMEEWKPYWQWDRGRVS